MKYSAVEVDGRTVVVPSRIADESDTRFALEALLDAALPHYNEAVEAVRDGKIPQAFQAVRRALKLAPYSPLVVEFGLLLSIQHGHFQLAQQLLTWAEKVEMDAEWLDYRANLHKAVQNWNRFLGDVSALRSKYRADDVAASYRELLLLAKSTAENSESLSNNEQAYLNDYGIEHQSSGTASHDVPASSGRISRQTILTAGLACLFGIGVGVVGPLLWGGEGTADSGLGSKSAAVADTMSSEISSRDDASGIAAELSQVNLWLAQGRPLEAHTALSQLEMDSISQRHQQVYRALQKASNEDLYRAGIAAWQAEDYATVARLLEPIKAVGVGEPQKKFYYLGMAAAKTGQQGLAAQSLKRLQTHLSADYPHFEAQSAYVLVRLLPDEEAKRYARIIADKYSDTLYYNSIVRAHL